MDSPYSHHHHRNNHHNNHRNHHNSSYQPPLTAAESQFRILCPADKAGGVIGKGGNVIRQLREDSGARIRIVEHLSTSHSDERVILISDPANPNPNNPNPSSLDSELSIAQVALIKVFERILKVDEERGEINHSYNHNNMSDDDNNVICRLLIGIDQVESVLCRGGKVLDNIRQDSCAQIRVLNRDCLPSCSSPGDELIQIAGNFQAVKKALMLISSCLLENPREGFFTPPIPENFGPNHRMILEEDVVFKLLCPAEKTGKLIGKGGFIIRGIQSETGASIKINETVTAESDERLVTISARESEDLRRSPAQDAFMLVHKRIAEIEFEPLGAIVARLLVPSQQIGCLMGKGGFIVNEMRRTTGAGIRIFGRDQGPKIHPNHEVVQVVGNMQTVPDALIQITSRIRESLFPPRQHNSSSYSNTFQELPSPSFRPRHDQVSPGRYRSPIGSNHGNDDRSFSQRPHPYSLSRGAENFGGANSELDHHHYSSDRAHLPLDHHHYSGDRAHLPSYVAERPPSPNSWFPQAFNHEHPGRYSDAGAGFSGMVPSNSQSGQIQMTTSVEIVVPHTLLPHVYGENRINLGHLTQFSGADVAVHDPKPGATEGRVILSGTPAQLHIAQSLVQAFIFCGLDF